MNIRTLYQAGALKVMMHKLKRYSGKSSGYAKQDGKAKENSTVMNKGS